MNREIQNQLFVTYEGDITETLEECGTHCPYRLNSNGDTEMVVRVESQENLYADDEIREMIEGMIVADCGNVGNVISHAWQFLSISPEEAAQ